jgi:Flp pilus assembly protein TadG
MAIEVIFLTPVLLLFTLLVVACGRYVAVQGELQALTRDAARAASLQRSLGAATGAARDAVAAEKPAGVVCGGIDVSGSFAPSTQVQVVTTRLTCTVSYGQLGLLGLPGGKDLTQTSSAPLDVYRRTAP